MDNLTPQQRRKNMQNICSANTKVEQKIAAALRERKIRFSRNVKSVIGKPDFLFRKKKVAVFVDSDFWHGHRTRCVMPKSNKSYWNEKIRRNKARDKIVTKELLKKGLVVVRIWEHNVKHHWKRSLNKILNKVS